MHQKRISTPQVSLVMLRSKKFEIQKKKRKKNHLKTVRAVDENQTECHKIEPNLSKDRAMSEEDNPLF
jgi:hypothetical protein